MYDAIIIGAGFSGLAAGIRLAYYENKTCLLERHTTIGGLNSFYRLRGRNYDVGLHAVTNFAPPRSTQGPLAKILRQLRIDWREFPLAPQWRSRIAFPSCELEFSNDVNLLVDEVRARFPGQVDAFARLISAIPNYDQMDLASAALSARQFVSEFLNDPMLTELLFCPLLFYGSGREYDMDLLLFFVLFRSIYLEGLGRPRQGVRPLLKTLTRKFKSLGGELRLNTGVRRILHENGRALGVVLDDGQEVRARHVLSSAGGRETRRLCGESDPGAPRAGSLSFVEGNSTLDCLPGELGFQHTSVFFSGQDRLAYRRPDELIDADSGVICSPNNFAYDDALEEGAIRVTCLANHDRWQSLSDEEYSREKADGYARTTAAAIRYVPDFRPHVVDHDFFTPLTIRRFTGHESGAVYGSPDKSYDGTTHLKNLYLCGTDQGFVGIIGAMTSGITMVNRHVLMAT